jgi:hypothetical protein
MSQWGSAEPLLAGESIASGHPIKGADSGVVRRWGGRPLDRGSASGKRSRVRSGSTRNLFSFLLAGNKHLPL